MVAVVTGLALLLALVAAAKYVECRRLKRRIERFQTRERAYRRMGELMALRTLVEENPSRLTLVEGGEAS